MRRGGETGGEIDRETDREAGGGRRRSPPMGATNILEFLQRCGASENRREPDGAVIAQLVVRQAASERSVKEMREDTSGSTGEKRLEERKGITGNSYSSVRSLGWFFSESTSANTDVFVNRLWESLCGWEEA